MKTYLFCNAHLDPVWLWQWENGLSEALSTFRSAADLLDEYPDFVFNHNESLLYEWIEEHDPELFARIKEKVKEGRWEIIGGWFLQPDCNIPTGESLLRQALRGRIYFYDKFEKVPVTAINFDSFGHAQGLVQMLKQCGYEYYVNIRPGKNYYDFASEDFIWRGYEGSEIIAHRSDKGYNSVLGKVIDELPGWMEERKDNETSLYLWGVGNHGGGPSRKDLNDIAALKANGADLFHAKPDEYFATVDKAKLPVVDHGLNPIMEGCYTSIIRIKQLHRRLENDLVMVEKMASHAALAGVSTYEKAKLDEAWRDLLFAEFHDSLPGSCTQPVEEDTIRILNHGLEIMAQLKVKYFLALTAGQEKIKEPNTTPLFVYNPHPFPYTQPIDVEFTLPKQEWHTDFSNPVVYRNGERLPSQSARESGNFNMDWCKRVIFEAELPPASMSRFDIHFEIVPKRPEPTTIADKKAKITIETARGQVVVNARSGLVDSYVVDGKEYVKPGAFAVDVFADSFSSWGGQPVFDPRSPLGRFAPMPAGEATDFSGVKGGIVQPVRVTDEGEVNAVIEADMQYHNSKMLVRYIVNKLTGILEMEIRVFFAENEKRLKLQVPTTLGKSDYIGQTVFGREKLLTDMTECVSQYWQAVANSDTAFAIIDDGVYGSCCENGVAGITLVRSAGYGAGGMTWGEPFHDPMYVARMDQGERRFRFMFPVGEKDAVLTAVDREAAQFNQRAYALAFCPSGKGVIPKPLVSIDQPNVSLSCFKQSERCKNAYILRVFEAQGKDTDVTVTLPIFGLETAFALRAFEIKTFKIADGKIEECDILEGSVPLK